MPEHEVPHSLKLVSVASGLRYSLNGKPLYGGDTIALCFSGGWLIGRFDWSSASTDPPRLHCSIELGGGRVAPCSIEIPDGALAVRKTTGVCLLQTSGHREALSAVSDGSDIPLEASTEDAV